MKPHEIDEEQGSRFFCNRLLQPLDKVRAVGKPGHRIEEREAEQALLALLAIRDVAKDRRKAHAAVLAPDRERQLGGELVPVAALGDEPDLLGGRGRKIRS